ncbi:MAG: hypothetical protein B6U76_00760 [Desulfurococcales archaeon ex4484_217_2]|nr:MAG: hypothetical protein B6U76_00760 [Desulfurococcales archaeon ex4484_217_2]
MKYRLLNYLACPYCKDKGFPLKLITIEVRLYEKRKVGSNASFPLCDVYCAYKEAFINELEESTPCNECIKYEVETAVLYCDNCMRWYPVIDGFPRMLPDNYRDKRRELGFLQKYADKIPDKIKYKGKPFNFKQK